MVAGRQVAPAAGSSVPLEAEARQQAIGDASSTVDERIFTRRYLVFRHFVESHIEMAAKVVKAVRDGRWKLVIHRDNMVKDTLDHFQRLTRAMLFQKTEVSFIGQTGVSLAGAPSRLPLILLLLCLLSSALV